MLDDQGMAYRYREYTQEPLSEAEIRHLLGLLDMAPAEVLRRRDPAARELGLTGRESADELITLMASHPTLLQRPIAVADERAVLGRPVENLLDLLPDGA